MSYKLIYTVPFADIDNVPCVVEIEKENYIGSSIELIAGSSPFSVDIEDDDFLYVPTRFSTATIRVVGSDYLQSLFSTAYQQFRVTFKKNNIVYWCGFIKPEIYTQDYSSTTFELEIECISAMSSLEFIDFKQTTGVDPEKRIFISLWKLLKNSILASNGQYEAVYFPHVYASSKEKYPLPENVLESLTISEQNFFDEDDKPMKIKEVIEEICRFMQWTCVDRQGELYFVDIDHTGAYRKYDLTFSDIITTISAPTVSVQQTGFTGSDHSLDILPGFNKVTVKCSNYEVSEILNFSIKYDELPYLVTLNDLLTTNEISHRVLLNPKSMKSYQYIGTHADPVTNIDDYIGNQSADNLLGAIPMRYCNYKLENGVPNITKYSYTDVFRVRLKNAAGNAIGGYTPVLRLTGPCVAYPKGVFCVDASAKYLRNAELSPLSKDAWGGNLMIGFKLFVGGYDFTKEENVLGETLLKCSYLSFGQYNNEDYKGAINDKFLFDPYSEASGKIIRTDSFGTNSVLRGGLEFILLASMYPSEVSKYGIFLQNFSVKFVPEDGVGTGDGGDRIYENVLNQEYANELDEIELKISSYNNDGACYSKVLLGDNYLTNNLYSAIEDEAVRMEEQLIRRIIKRYSAPQIKLTQVIKAAADLTPITRLSDNYMVNKKFINAGGTIDYQMNQFTCIMIEV